MREHFYLKKRKTWHRLCDIYTIFSNKSLSHGLSILTIIEIVCLRYYFNRHSFLNFNTIRRHRSIGSNFTQHFSIWPFYPVATSVFCITAGSLSLYATNPIDNQKMDDTQLYSGLLYRSLIYNIHFLQANHQIPMTLPISNYPLANY